MADTFEGTRIEALQAQLAAREAEVDALQVQLAKSRKRGGVEFLGESLPAEVLTELATTGKLSVLTVKSRRDGLHGDGRNLWLQVTKTGRSWVFRYRFSNRQREMGLGSVNDVSLAEARGRAAICRRLVREGVDPIERRRSNAAEDKVAEAKFVTFRQAAERYIAAQTPSWKNEKHADQWTATLKAYVYPVFGELPVQRIDTGLVTKALGVIWNEKAETAARVRGRIEAVLEWATDIGLRSGENPARRGRISNLLGKRSKARRVKHHAALPYKDMNAFWVDLGGREGVSAEALRFTILTAARTGEVIGSTWAEIDLQAKTWTIPGARMKAGREHRVPLSALAVEVLLRLKPLRESDASFVFPGARKGRALSSMAMLMLLRKMERTDITAHGFRSTFRDWAAETTTFAGDMVEMALAHTVADKVEAAYRRGSMFEKRMRLMDSWAKYCTTPPKVRADGDNVHHLHEAVA
jgi:integrase